MKGNRPKIHGNSPKNGQKMKHKRLKNSQKPEKISKTKKITPSEDRAAQKSESSCPPPKR